MRYRLAAPALAAAVLTLAAGCATEPDDATLNASTVLIGAGSGGALNLLVGAQRQLVVFVLDGEGNVIEGASLTFASDNAAVATIDDEGLLTAVGAGNAEITVTSGTASGTLDVVVTAPPAPRWLMVSPDELFLVASAPQPLSATVYVGGVIEPDEPVTWLSRNPAVATVTSAGVVTAAAASGSTWIVATSGTASDSAQVFIVAGLNGRTTVGSRAFGAAVSSGGAMFVTLMDEDRVARLDPATHAVSAFITVGDLPTSLTFNNAGTRAYVGNQNGGSVSVIDVASNTVSGTITLPAATPVVSVAVVPGDSLLIVGTTGPLYVYRLPGHAFVRSVAMDGIANALAIRDSIVYVNNTAGQVRIVDWRSGQLLGTITTGGVTQGIVVSSDGQQLYVANEAGQFEVWDIATGQMNGAPLLMPGGGGFSMAQHPVTGHLYVGTSYYSNRVNVIDPVARSIVRVIYTGGTVRRIAFTQNGAVGIVANEGGWVDFID